MDYKPDQNNKYSTVTESGKISYFIEDPSTVINEELPLPLILLLQID